MTPKRKNGIHHKRPGFMVYLSPEEKAEIKKAVRESGDAKLSAFVRRAALKEARAVNAATPPKAE